jgi:hypothetical protein
VHSCARREGVLSARLPRRALRIRQCCGDRSQYIIYLAVYLLIPEADHTIIPLGKISCSRGVLLMLVGMVAAVELDYQTLFDAAQICEVGANAVLSAEFESAETLGSEVLPQLLFRLSRLRT